MKENIFSGVRLNAVPGSGPVRSILWFTVFIALILFYSDPARADTSYRVFFQNGRVMTGVDKVSEKGDRISIQKHGITVEVKRAAIVKVEEYDRPAQGVRSGVRIGAPGQEELPDYLQYGVGSQQAAQQRENERIQRLKSRYQVVSGKLKRIEALERKSKELERLGRQKWRARKARIARKEKAEIDKNLESLREEKEYLLKEKEALGSKIGMRD